MESILAQNECSLDTVKSGEVILRKLFYEFTVLAEKKINYILQNDSLEKPLANSQFRDAQFEQLLNALGAVAEHCLPSQLRALFLWHQKQISATSVFDDENKRLFKAITDSQSSKGGQIVKNFSGTGNSSLSSAAGTLPEVFAELDLFYILEKRDLAVEFIFCLVLIEILKQLHLHPGYDELTSHIESLCFKHFRFYEDIQRDGNPNLVNINMLSDLYAEVIGVLAQSRFKSVKKRFMAEFNELRTKDPGPITTHSIISLLMGMKFFRIKMVPIEEFEAGFQFLNECATYFLEVKDKDIKHALAGLFVEILVPVAATVKNEVNIPCLKNFVELLYSPTMDLCTKKKHCLALFPLVTCLLCVSQKNFFLAKWHNFLAMCLQHLRNRDPKMSRVALESLYRLLWVYMIRIRCESNSATQSRLDSIVNSLFPKGTKSVVPRDTPLNIFVKIIQFIAQERLEFAMKGIVYDLLSVGRPFKVILTPERMSIGLRSFLVVADSLQQKDGEPPMPRTLGVLPSGNTLRVKKTFLNKMLTDEMAKNIGMNHYYPNVRKILGDILKALDVQFGKPYMTTNVQNVNKEPEELLSGERKPKIDLFRTCIAAIPRLIPDGIPKHELITLLARLTVHLDNEMCGLAFQSLQNLIVDFADWREDVIDGFLTFVLYEIGDQFQTTIENSIKRLLQLISSWKNAIQNQIAGVGTVLKSSGVKSQSPNDPSGSGSSHQVVPGILALSKMDQITNVLYKVDAFALVMLCYCRQPNRRLSALVLKESRAIANLLQNYVKISGFSLPKVWDEPAATIIDSVCSIVVENCLPFVSANERSSIVGVSYQVDLQWLAERAGPSWVLYERSNDDAAMGATAATSSAAAAATSSTVDIGSIRSKLSTVSGTSTVNSTTSGLSSLSGHNTISSAISMTSSVISEAFFEMDGASELKLNAWNVCLMTMLHEIVKSCPNVSLHAWNFAFQRLKSLFGQIDPNPANDNKASILRGSASSSNLKRSISSFERSFNIELFKNYLMMACCVAPSAIVLSQSNSKASTIPEMCTSPDSSLAEKIVVMTPVSGLVSVDPGSRSPTTPSRTRQHNTAQSLFKLILEQMRSEQGDLRKAVVLGLSQVNFNVLADLLEDLSPLFREAIDRKQENVRRRKRRELLRLQLARLFKFISERKIFAQCPALKLDARDGNSLGSALTDYIEGMRLYFESESSTTSDSFGEHILEIKESYCHFVINLLQNFPIGQRANKLSEEMRRNLFQLFTSWSGKFGQMFVSPNNFSRQDLDFERMTELEFLSVSAMSTTLCSGALFDKKNLVECQSLYHWLTQLLKSGEKRINKIGLDTLILLLENNLDDGPLLEWLLECCYTREAKIADSCFTALATLFSIRDYPCDRYISIIIVAIVNVACARIEMQQLALQLLQILDQRFLNSSQFRSQNEVTGSSKSQLNVNGTKTTQQRHSQMGDAETALLPKLFPCTLEYIAKRMAQLQPQLSMIIFSEITFRLQSAKPTVARNLLSFLVPWLYNMILVDPTNISLLDDNNRQRQTAPPGNKKDDNSGNILNETENGSWNRLAQQQHRNNVHQLQPPLAPFDDPMNHHHHHHSALVMSKEGWGSIESTEMVLNNLFYITIKFGDDYGQELEQIWSSLCISRPNNLKIIIRYLFILTSLSPCELLPFTKRISIYLARAQPETLVDYVMTELQAVEFLNFNAERTEAFPFFRIVNRKCSASHLLDDPSTPTVAASNAKRSDSTGKRDAGTIHTKRHSKDIPGKFFTDPYGLESGGGGGGSGSCTDSAASSDDANGMIGGFYGDLNIPNDNGDSSIPFSDRGKSTPQPRPLPMPEYGGFYAPLNDFLAKNSNGNIGSAANGNAGNAPFHRCNLALMLLTDIVTQDIGVIDWSPHIPLMLHILFLGMDHPKALIYEHCKQLLLNLLIVATKHNDNLTVARILLNNQITQQGSGLARQLQFPYDSFNTSAQLTTEDCCEENEETIHQNSSGETSTNLDVHEIFTRSTEELSPNSRKSPHPTTAATENVSLDEVKMSDVSGSSDSSIDTATTEVQKLPIPTERRPPEEIESGKQKISVELYIKGLIDFLSSKKGTQLWCSEDITAKVWQVRSAEQMECFVEYIMLVFRESIPYAKIEERWAEIALQLALSCSSRHYAGRSLQIFRALKIPINTRMLSDILSRLIETVSEQGDDMQGYVTELMLTLESAIDAFDLKSRNIMELINEYFYFENDFDEISQTERVEDSVADLFNDSEFNLPTSTPQKRKKNSSSADSSSHENDISASSSSTLVTAPGITASQSHTESLAVKLHRLNSKASSYSMSFPTRKLNFLEDSKPKFRNAADIESFYGSSKLKKLGRSQSAQSLMKNQDFTEEEATEREDFEDKTSILAQFFWIAIVLLESDYEHEFLLSLRLIDKLLDKISLVDPDCQEKIEKVFQHFNWHNFPGVHSLLLRGLSIQACYEPTLNLLHKLTPLLMIPVVDPSKSDTAFPFHVMAMLPYMIYNYDDPNEFCIQAAVSFATWCNENSTKLENLAAVMTLYSKRCFMKDDSQWTKCVVKYLYDAYPTSFPGIISYLVEAAERGPNVFLNHILSILNFMINYIDMPTVKLINQDILRVASKFIEGPAWKEALKIMKLVVSRSSSLTAPSYTSSSNYSSSIISSICSTYANEGIAIGSGTFTDSDFGSMKQRELPGRTMEFLFDLDQSPIVGVEFIQKRQKMCQAKRDAETEQAANGKHTALETLFDTNGESFPVPPTAEEFLQHCNQPQPPIGCSASSANVNTSTLKRSVSNQTRIRERFISLLNRCGQRISGLPKSPSVIFSQNSDLIEQYPIAKSSMASSVEDVSGTNNDISGDSKHDDEASNEFTLKEFDFLDNELDSQEGESLDNFNWGVRRKSLSNLDTLGNVDEGSGQNAKSFEMSSYSTGTLKATKFNTRKTILQIEALKVKDHEYSSDEDLDPSEEGGVSGQVKKSRPASLVSHGSSHSLGSDTDRDGVNTGGQVPGFIGHQLRSVEEAEARDAADADDDDDDGGQGPGGNGSSGSSNRIEQWSVHFGQLKNDTTGTTCAISNQILSLIFRNVLTRVAELTQECCQLLPHFSQLGSSASAKFYALMNIVRAPSDFPFVFVDPRLFLNVPKLLDRHRNAILELQTHWETFNEKRNLLASTIRKCQKFVARGPNNNKNIENGFVEKLCKEVSGLHFQLCWLLECYLSQFIDAVLKRIPESTEVRNYSSEINRIKHELNKCSYKTADGPPDLIPASGSSIDGQEHSFASLPVVGKSLTKANELELKELIQAGQYANAVRLAHIFRQSIPDLFADDCVEAILTIYCRSIFDNQTLYLVITEHNLEPITRQIRETSYEVNNLPGT